MADTGPAIRDRRSLLAFPPPDSGCIPRQATRPPFRPVKRSSSQKQGVRLLPELHSLQSALKQDRAQLVNAKTASDPELVAVFDLAGTVERFLQATAHIDGLEFLADLREEEVEADDDFFYKEDGRASADQVPQSLYMMMTNARAVGQLVRLFELWRQDTSVRVDRADPPRPPNRTQGPRLTQPAR